MLPLVGLSCLQKSFDTDEALWEYIKDERNGYIAHKTIAGVNYSLLYKPTDLLVKQELGANADKSQVENLRSKYGQYCYFNLSMSRGGQEILSSVAGDRNAFGKMVKDLSFGMSDKIHLYTENRDTIAMADYSYPRMYGMSKNTSLLLVYPREELEDADEIHLAIEDLGFGTGEVRFKQAMNHIKKQPELQF